MLARSKGMGVLGHNIKQAVVDEQLLEFQSNLNGNMIRNLKGGRKEMQS
jgi:hypothetical protein